MANLQSVQKANDEQKLTLSVEEAARILGIGRSLAFEMVRQNKIASLRFGRRIVIPVKALEKLIEDAIASNEKP